MIIGKLIKKLVNQSYNQLAQASYNLPAITSMTVLLDIVIVSIFCAAILAMGIVLYGKYFRI